jgi:hypothetical protein
MRIIRIIKKYKNKYLNKNLLKDLHIYNNIYMKKKLLKTRKMGKTTETTYQISLDDDEPDFTMDDVKDILKEFVKNEKNDKTDILISGLNGKSWVLLKSLKQKLLTEKEIEDYYISKVKDASKYSQFKQLQIYIVKND